MYSDCIPEKRESMRHFFFLKHFVVVVVVLIGCVDELKCVVECTFRM